MKSVAGKKFLPKISDKDVRDAADALDRHAFRH